MNRSHQAAPGSIRQGWAAGLQDKVIAVVLAMMALVPLLTGSTFLRGAVKVATFEAFGAILLLLIASRLQLKGAASRIKDTLTAGPNLPILLLVAYSAISCAFSPYRTFSLMETMRVGFCALLYFAMVYHLRSKGALQVMTDGLMAVTAVVCLVAFAQMGVGGILAIDGTFGSHELLGSFLMMMLPIALVLGLTERGDSKRQLASQVVALMVGACLLVARTRSAWIGSAFSMLVLAIMAVRYSPVLDAKRSGNANMLQSLRQRKHLIVVPAIILTGAVALTIGLSQSGSVLSNRAATFSKLSADNSFQDRIAMLNGSLKMAAQKPLTGWGIGTFQVIGSAFTGKGDSPKTVLAHGATQSNLAHNYYVQTLAETGAIGLGLYLAALAVFFVTGLRGLRNLDSGLRKAVLMGCLAATAGQVIDAVGSPAYQFASVSMFQWIVLGMGMFAAGVGGRVRTEEAATEVVSFKTTSVARRVQYAVSAAVAIAAMSAIVPTMNAAMAVSYSGGAGTFAVRGAGGQDTNSTLTANKTITVQSTIDGSPVSGTNDGTPGDNDYCTVAVTGTPGFGSFVTVNQAQAIAGKVIITRNGTATGTGRSVTVTVTYHGSDGTNAIDYAPLTFVVKLG